MANFIPRAEHPNPQFERESWLNLNGEWEFEIDNSVSGRERGLQNAEHLSSKIIVPFCPESRLSGVENTDFMNCVWYRRDIEISESELEGIVILHFGAVDYECQAWLNGAPALVLRVPDGDVSGALLITARAARIARIDLILNPRKLERLP